MDSKILSKLIQTIKPNVNYEFELIEGKNQTKSGIDWRGTIISLRTQLTDKDGLRLIDYFSNPLKEED